MTTRQTDEFKPGIYLHYKGKLYEADHLMRDANYPERLGVHYIGLELEGAKDGPRHMVRTWEDWRAMVHEDGTKCDDFQDDKCQDTQQPVTPRFRYLGPFFEARMVPVKSD